MTDLQDRILHAGQQDFIYMEIMQKVQQSIGIGIGDSIGIVTNDGTSMGKSDNKCRGRSTCHGTFRGTCGGALDVDYCLITDGLVRLLDKIYLSNNSELMKVALKKFHVKPYSCHPSYQNMLIGVKIFYY